MRLDHILTCLDLERRQLTRTGERADRLADVTRLVSGGQHAIVFSSLSPDRADAAIAREIAHHRALGVPFEWKVYAHDEPADLGARLERQGFVAGEREAVLVCDVTTISDTPTAPGCRVVPVDDPEGLVQYRRVAEAVLRKNYDPTIRELGEALAAGSKGHRGYVAYIGTEPAAVGRLYTDADSVFGGLYGGSTREEFRGRGCYRALVAARARDAQAFGARFLIVDALPTSRPILERLGFQWLTETWPCEWRPVPGSALGMRGPAEGAPEESAPRRGSAIPGVG